MHTSTLLQLQDLQSDTRLQCSNISRLKAQNFQQLRPNWGCLEEHTRQQLHPAKSCSPAGGGGLPKDTPNPAPGQPLPRSPPGGGQEGIPLQHPLSRGVSFPFSPHPSPLPFRLPLADGAKMEAPHPGKGGGGGGTPKKTPRGCRQAGGEARGRAGSGPAATMAVICFR